VYVSDIAPTARQWNERIAYIRQEKARGHLDIAVAPIRAKTTFDALSDLTDVTPNADDWPDADIARYFGVRSVVARP